MSSRRRKKRSSRKRRTAGLASYAGLIAFYEDVEGGVKLSPYMIIGMAVATIVAVIVLQVLAPPI
ncbi:MAG: preprotein translocase subunit Sec61beta [Thermoprotei archaeon]|nr:MAG: preprotein translocase subunit Sec61beta [Thermoprotei archaeon]